MVLSTLGVVASTAATHSPSTACRQLVHDENQHRVEIERREAKARSRVIDASTRIIDDQLLYVAQLKREWLRHKNEVHASCRVVMEQESARRATLQEAYVNELSKLLRRYQQPARLGSVSSSRLLSAYWNEDE